MATPGPDPVATAQGLTEALSSMAARLEAVKDYGRRSRRLVVFDIGLTVVVAAATWLAASASSHASSAGASAAQARAEVSQQRANNISACQQTNTARAENAALWNHLIALSLASPRRPGETAAQAAAAKKELEGLKAYVRHTFASRDCESAYGR